MLPEGVIGVSSFYPYVLLDRRAGAPHGWLVCAHSDDFPLDVHAAGRSPLKKHRAIPTKVVVFEDGRD